MLDQYTWLEGHISSERIAELEKLRKNVEYILNQNLLPHYTDHSISHCDRIIQILGMMLGENLSGPRRSRLSDDELYVLCLSAFYHDIGMQIPLAHGISKTVDELTVEDLEVMRKNHGEASRKVLIKTLKEETDTLKLGILSREVKPYVPYVATICKVHQSDKDYDPDDVQNLGSNHGSPRIRMGVLVALLRMADHLDCDYRRVDMEKLEQFRLAPESELYWLCCHYIDAVTFEHNRIQLIASWPDGISSSEVEFMGSFLIAKMKDEFSIWEESLWKNNIKLKFIDKILKKETDYTHSKRKLSERVSDFIRSHLEISEPEHVEVDETQIGKLRATTEFIDWMTYWGMIGNPFLDYPLSYGSEKLVETKDMMQILAETASFLKGEKGELKLLIGDRGLGKTTLFQGLEGSYGEDYDVLVIDVAQKVADVRSTADLNQMVFRSIYDDLTLDADRFSTDRLLDSTKRGNKKVICVDSLDRLTEDKDPYVREFFKVAQHVLTSLKQSSVVVISCSDRWVQFIDSDDVPYISVTNQWTLQRFSLEDARDLIEKRLKSTGLSFSDIFEDKCLSALHTLGKGNPRKILEHCEAVCRLAAKEEMPKITLKFVRDQYEKKFGDAFTRLLEDLVREQPKHKEALSSIYLFFAEMERRNLDTAEGWEYLAQILKGGLERSSVKVSFWTPLKFLTMISQDLRESKSPIEKYVVNRNVREFFDALSKKGYSARDFMSFYSAYPYMPSEEEENLLRSLKSIVLEGDDVEYFERARIQYNDVIKAERGVPAILMSRSWDVVESMIVAILIKNKKLERSKYESDKEEVFVEDRFGIRRFKRGAGKVQAEHSKEIKELFFKFMKELGIWMDSFTSLNWILFTRNNIIRGKSEYYVKYGETELALCRQHLEQVFRELLTIYS